MQEVVNAVRRLIITMVRSWVGNLAAWRLSRFDVCPKAPDLLASFMTSPLPRLATWLVMLIILIQPLASALRGISVPIGQGVILLADLLLGLVVVANVHRIRDHRIQAALVLMVFSIVYTMTIPNFPPAGLIGGVRKSYLVLIALTVGAMIGQDRRRGIHLAIIVSGVIVAAYAIKQHFFFSTFDSNILATQTSDKYTNLYKGEQRSFSILSSGFHVGMICLILISYSLFTRMLSRIFSFTIFSLAMVAIYFTFTRTCLIIALVMIAYWVCRSLRVPVVFAALGLMVVYASLVAVAPDQVPNPFTAVSDDTRFTGRSVSYVDAAQDWGAEPIRLVTGFGVGSAGSAQGDLFDGPAHIEPHNIFLKYVFEMGVAFGLPFLLLIGSLVVTAIVSARKDGERDFVAMIVLAVVISGLSITVVEAWPANVYLFLLIGIYLGPKPVSVNKFNQADVDTLVKNMLSSRSDQRPNRGD